MREFTIETTYSLKALAAMAKGLRKTVRRKRSRRTRILGCIAVVMGALLLLSSLSEGFTADARTVITLLAVLAILAALIWEDAINGYFAKKRMLKGTEHATAVFGDSGYVSETAIAKTDWSYDIITAVAETPEYLVFAFSSNHAQCYDKGGISGGTADEFRAFIEEMTGKKVQKV